MKNLVEDVYKVLEDGKKPSSAAIKKFAINIANLLKDRLTEKERVNTLRMSNIGKPVRKIWYDFKYPKEVKYSGSDKLKFLYGDIIEELVLFLIELAGYDVTDRQKEVDLDGVKGHIDGMVDGVLIDVKSASQFAFDKFKKHSLNDVEEDAFGYIGQISGYAEALRKDIVYFIIVNKVTGEILVEPYGDLELIDAFDKIQEIREALNKEEPPAKLCYPVTVHDNGNEEINRNCFYCAHKTHCFENLQAYQYSNKVRYFSKVVKEPRVDKA